MSTASRPTITQLREVAQPPDHLGRVSAEHWVGGLFHRRVSIYLTWLLIPTRITPNGVTWIFIFTGPVGAACLLIPGIFGPILAVVLIQIQGILDCSDGELARWRKSFSPTGIFLDRIGHYVTEAALPIFLGIRAAGGLGVFDGWTTLGCLLATIHMINRAETDLVQVSRALSGMPPTADTSESALPPSGLIRTVRRALRFVPFFRCFVATEFTLLALAAGVVDLFLGSLVGTRVLLIVLLPLAILTAVGHLAAILKSGRLRRTAASS